MFHSITACLPQCLRAADVHDEPMDDATGTREGITRAGRTSSVRGSQASRSGTTPFMLMQEVAQEVRVVQEWPKSELVLRLIASGRDLICRAGQIERVDKHLKQAHTEWRESLQEFKQELEKLPTLTTLTTLPTSEWQPAVRPSPPPRVQVYVDEQLRLARRDMEMGLEAFSRKSFPTAKSLDERAAQQLHRARQLVDVCSQTTPEVHGQLIELLEQGRLQNSFILLDRKLGALAQHMQMPARRPLPSERQWSVTSSEAAQRPVENDDVIKRLRSMREQARQLPPSQKLKASFMAQCDALEREVRKGLRSVPMDLVVQQLNALGTTLQADSNVRKLKDAATAELKRVEEAVGQLPSSLSYRKSDATARLASLTAAYYTEEYSKATQIFAEATHVNQATFRLLEGDYDPNVLANNFQLRNQWVDSAKPLLNRATTYMERMLSDRFEQVLRMMDEATDVEMMSRCLYELGDGVNKLQEAAAYPRTSGTPAAWNLASAMGS